MRIAKDGKPFDIDNIGEDLRSDEVEIIQYLRPEGKRRRMAASLTVELARKADNLIISAEELSSGEIAIYGRRIAEKKEDEIVLLAENGSEEKSPDNVLIKLIEELTDHKNKKGE